MSVATQQKYPSLAEIVRQETDGGRLIVQFYLGVADGTLDGFRDHHRMAAANRIGKIAPKLVAEYLQKYYNSQCRDSLRGTLLPLVRRSPITKNPPEGSEQATRGPSVFRRRLTQLVREETGDGRTIFNFLNGVMHGTYTGFKPHHRLEAAKELASYLTPPQEPAPAKAGVPVQTATQRGGAGLGSHPIRPEPFEEREVNSPVIPAQAGTHPRSPEPTPTVIPVKTGTHPQAGSAEAPRFPTNNSKPKTKNSPPISVEELEQANFDPTHIARYRFARDEITGAIYAFDHKGPIIVDENGVTHRISPKRIAGYARASRTNENQYRIGKTTHTQRRRQQDPNARTRNPIPETKDSPSRSPPKVWV